MTEVEQYVRDRVRAIGEPWLIVPPECAPSLLAVALWKLFAEEREVYVLFAGLGLPKDREAWARSTRSALLTVRNWTPSPPEGVVYVHEEGTIDIILRVEATALGLSLLQLALNRAGSRLAIWVWP